MTQHTFRELGIPSSICTSLQRIGWNNPTEIQEKVIPLALKGNDIIGLAETGSGKTGAFSLPILTFLLNNPVRFFAVIVAPTRELAFQINEVFEALGGSIGLLTVCLVGGVSMVDQAIAIARGPHIIISTPGRLIDHLQNTKGFNLRSLKVLVLDEADRMLSMDFEREINELLVHLPSERNTYLFSATMTSKVQKLKRASLTNPVEVSVSSQFQIPKGLLQQYVFMPAKWKECYLVHILNELKGQSSIIFVSTCANALRIALLLCEIGFSASCLHGQLSQVKRISAINKFKAGSSHILVATDVASRGLDIPHVDVVLNFDIPMHGKTYIHRVGRTARAGRSGQSITFVTQYDIEAFQQLETLLGTKLPEFTVEESAALVLLERVTDAQRVVTHKCREISDKKSKKRKSKHKEESELPPSKKNKNSNS